MNNSVKIDNSLLVNGEAISEMSHLEDNSVDMVFVDLPYGTTNNKWDSVIPYELLWEQLNRVVKPRGAIVMTAAQPFTSLLLASNLSGFKHEVIWKKTVGSRQLNIKHMPLLVHESVLIFSSDGNRITTYNEQLTKGKPYSIDRNIKSEDCYQKQKKNSKDNDGFRHAQSVIEVPNPRIKGGHPTQKPVKLIEYFIKTYTNEGETVLDCCAGSFSTGKASQNLGRKFIGIELEEKYFNKGVEWLSNEDYLK